MDLLGELRRVHADVVALDTPAAQRAGICCGRRGRGGGRGRGRIGIWSGARGVLGGEAAGQSASASR
ncbi:MAG TPA: hypothetical protein VGM33_10060 [Baekduia sp.]|jgi:hypothetical protein